MNIDVTMDSVSRRKRLINPECDKALYDGWHYSQAVQAGRIIWSAGQVGIDLDAKPAEGMTQQARLAFENLKRVLAEAGATLSDVVELTSFHIDLRGELAAFTSVKDEYLPRDFPAWTSVGVVQLALPELRVEIRAVAVVGSGERDSGGPL